MFKRIRAAFTPPPAAVPNQSTAYLHYKSLWERADAEVHRTKSLMFNMLRTMAGQTRGLQRQARLIKRLRGKVAARQFRSDVPWLDGVALPSLSTGPLPDMPRMPEIIGSDLARVVLEALKSHFNRDFRLTAADGSVVYSTVKPPQPGAEQPADTQTIDVSLGNG